MIGEVPQVMLGTVKTLDSATFCHDRDDFQMTCDDPGCPRCDGKTLAVSTLKGPTILVLLAQDLIGRLPHAALPDGVTPVDYRMNFYGCFPFSTLNRSDFRDRRGNVLRYGIDYSLVF